ncbi:MAG: preprotein translocase subunit YajC [Candidatus Eisenbacteria bacterium]
MSRHTSDRVFRAALAAVVATATAVTPAFAQASAGGGSPIAAYLPFLQIGLIFVIMYFLLIRPQQKRQQDLQKMQGALKKGDKVVTQAGIIGTIAGIGDDTATLQVDRDVKIEFQRSAIVGRVGERKPA